MTVTGPGTDGVSVPARPERLGLRDQLLRFVAIGGLGRGSGRCANHEDGREVAQDVEA